MKQPNLQTASTKRGSQEHDPFGDHSLNHNSNFVNDAGGAMSNTSRPFISFGAYTRHK